MPTFARLNQRNKTSAARDIERRRFLAGEGILWLKRGRDFQILDYDGNVAVDSWLSGRSPSEFVLARPCRR